MEAMRISFVGRTTCSPSARACSAWAGAISSMTSGVTAAVWLGSGLGELVGRGFG